MFYDTLTSLPNAVLFLDRLQQSLAHASRRQQRVGVIYLDIDGFMQIVNFFGCAEGNALVKEIADRLQSCIQRNEDTLARLGGDQFAIILGDIDGLKGIQQIQAKIAQAMSRYFWIGGRGVTVTLSSAASLFPQDGKEWSSLLRAASMAMHLVKERGGDNHLCYGEPMPSHLGEINPIDLQTPSTASGKFFKQEASMSYRAISANL